MRAKIVLPNIIVVDTLTFLLLASFSYFTSLCRKILSV